MKMKMFFVLQVNKHISNCSLTNYELYFQSKLCCQTEDFKNILSGFKILKICDSSDKLSTSSEKKYIYLVTENCKKCEERRR